MLFRISVLVQAPSRGRLRGNVHFCIVLIIVSIKKSIEIILFIIRHPRIKFDYLNIHD